MATKEDLTHVAPLVKNTLLSQLANARTAMGLTQAELASRAGVSRMTIQRTEAEDADTSLSTFVLLALALNHTPRLVAKSDDDDKDQYTPLPAGIVHRGYAFNRTKSDLEYRDRQREAALAQEWEAANQDRLGLPPLMQTLVPNHTQEQASAAATAIQWLGSEQGFEFLVRVLGRAGYDVLVSRKQPPKSAFKARGR